jgi:hypothetical protein
MSATYPTVVGGLRSRLIFDNLFYLIQTNLDQLGWLDGNGRRHSPIHLVVESQDITTEIPINTLTLSDENMSSVPWEVGSQLTQDTRYYYVDFFAESDPVGKHLIGDVRDVLHGKYASLGRTAPNLDVWDLRTNGQPTNLLFSCDLINIRVDRAHGYREPWLRHWYSIQFALLDWYTNDADVALGPEPQVVEAQVGMTAEAT